MKKFPLCSKYDITLTKKGYCEICGDATTACAEEVELALSKAYENGMLEGYKQGKEKMAELQKQLIKARKFLGKKDRRIQRLKAELSK